MTLADVKAVVLHELRGAGPPGLSRDELRDRVRGEDLLGALAALLADGALVEGPGGLLTISAVQRDNDALREVLCWARHDQTSLRERAAELEARVAELETSQRAAGSVPADVHRAVLDDANAYRDVAGIALRDADDARARADALSVIVGGHALAAFGQACAAAAGERHGSALGRRLYALSRASVEARSEGEREAYRLGLLDASWIASYVIDEPPLRWARLICTDKSNVRCTVLGRIPGEAAVLLSSPFTGRVRCDLDGRAPGGWRLNDADAAELRAAFAPVQEVA